MSKQYDEAPVSLNASQVIELAKMHGVTGSLIKRTPKFECRRYALPAPVLTNLGWPSDSVFVIRATSDQHA
jgi:hypothetical protein